MIRELHNWFHGLLLNVCVCLCVCFIHRSESYQITFTVFQDRMNQLWQPLMPKWKSGRWVFNQTTHTFTTYGNERVCILISIISSGLHTASALWKRRWNSAVPADDPRPEGEAAFSPNGCGEKQRYCSTAGTCVGYSTSSSFPSMPGGYQSSQHSCLTRLYVKTYFRYVSIFIMRKKITLNVLKKT